MTTTQPEPTRDPWYVWSNGTEDGSWHQVNQGTLDECETFAAVRQNPNIYVQEPGVKYLVLRDGTTAADVLEEHKGHPWPYDYCQLCRYEVAEAEAAREAEHAAEIDRLNTNLVDQVGTALIEIGKAQATLAQLVSPAVFDIEYAESADGDDVLEWLKIARRGLRAVERIAIAHRDLYVKQPGAGS